MGYVIAVQAALALYILVRVVRIGLGNALLVVAGVDRETLGRAPVSRAYYVGLGVSIILAATISTAGLLEATSIAFHTPPVPLLVCGTIYFFLLLGLDRWLVSDAKAGFAHNAKRDVGRVAAWFVHLLVELLKVAPRVAVALLSSWLFAQFLVMAVFAPEVKEELKQIQIQQQSQYDQQVDAAAQDIAAKAQQVITQADKAKKDVQGDFEKSQTALTTAYQQEQNALKTAKSNGLHCSPVARYATRYNSRGQSYRVYLGKVTECPSEVDSIFGAYDDARTRNAGPSQSRVNRQKAAIDKQYHVAEHRHEIESAKAVAQKRLGAYRPASDDGLLARMHALGLITHKPAGVCPATPSTADLAGNPACVAHYSADAAQMNTRLRYWLLLLEVLPVLFKFVHSLLPRNGYAALMGARDEVNRIEAELMVVEKEMHKRAEVTKARRLERVRMETEGAVQERQMREVARQESVYGIRQIRARISQALTHPPTRLGNLRLTRRNRPIPGDAIEPHHRVDPEVARIPPARQAIRSEDFLL
ncbi:DUF4407 domain-containing protein [Streptomyces sp. NBC_00433]